MWRISVKNVGKCSVSRSIVIIIKAYKLIIYTLYKEKNHEK